jgi:hypothetical protein
MGAKGQHEKRDSENPADAPEQARESRAAQRGGNAAAPFAKAIRRVTEEAGMRGLEVRDYLRRWRFAHSRHGQFRAACRDTAAPRQRRDSGLAQRGK